MTVPVGTGGPAGAGGLEGASGQLIALEVSTWCARMQYT